MPRKTLTCPHCGGEVPVQAAAKAPAAVPAELEALRLYAEDMKLIARWAELREVWEQTYPYLDVMAEVRKAHAWEVANPSLRKSNRARFLTNWLNRAQDTGRRRAPPAPAEDSPQRLLSFDEQMAAFLARSREVS